MADRELPASESGERDQLIAQFIGAVSITVAHMEHRFTPLGNDLGQIVAAMGTLAQLAGQGFSFIRTEMSEGALGELDTQAQQALAGLQRQLMGMQLRLKPLENVSGDLYALRSFSRQMEALGKSLFASGGMFAVETARCDESKIAFGAFVKELRALASEIGALAGKMDEDSQAASEALKQARCRIADSIASLDPLASAMQGAFTTASQEISELMTRTCQVVDQVEQHRVAISSHTDGLIYYLQFGDIVRQKCEHILEAAQDGQAAGDTLDHSHLTLLVHTSIRQLEAILQEVTEARTRLAGGFNSLEQELSQLAHCGAALSAQDISVSGGPWQRLKANLQSLQHIQASVSLLSQDAMQTAANAGSASASLHEQLRAVRRINHQLHLLALNAIIQTFQLGARGQVLETLARNVNDLHRTCESLVGQIVAVLDQIAGDIAGCIDQEPDLPPVDLGGIDQLEGLKDRARGVMREVLTHACHGEALLRTALSRLDSLDSLSQEIEGQIAILAQLAQSLPDTDADPAASTAFDTRMLNRYTMQSERDAHARARGKSIISPREPAGASRAVRHAPDLILTPALEGDDLGDNIELF